MAPSYSMTGRRVGERPQESSEMFRHLVFLGAAIVLGLAWYAALLLTGLHTILLSMGVSAALGLGLLGAVIAVIWRRPILRSGTLEQAAALAVGLPLLGAVVFVLGMIGAGWLTGSDRPATAQSAAV